MSPVDRSNILKKLLLALWGMATLVLIFCVVLLVNEIRTRGQQPWDAVWQEAGKFPVPANPESQSPATRAREVMLYFANANAQALSPERHSVEFSDSTVENCRQVLKRLIAGPREALTPVLPATTRIRAIYLRDDGELVVDFSRELVSEHVRLKSASLEALLVYGVVHTLAQPALQLHADRKIERVRFLFEGASPPESFPAHLDLSEPIAPDPAWNEAAREGPAHG